MKERSPFEDLGVADKITLMRDLFFWDSTQRTAVILCRRFFTLRDITEERFSHLHRDGSFKSRAILGWVIKKYDGRFWTGFYLAGNKDQ